MAPSISPVSQPHVNSQPKPATQRVPAAKAPEAQKTPRAQDKVTLRGTQKASPDGDHG
jgi:hypothetical protein